MSQQIARSSGANIARRALAAIGATGGRHLFAILSGVVIARSLGPVQYGYLAFLLAGFTTLHTLLDLSSSQAFYTLVCRAPWAPSKLRLYYGWVGLQLALPLVAIWLLLPSAWLAEIWRGQPRGLIVMALFASFSQRVLWQMVMQIYESCRLTIRVQIVTVAIMMAHLIVVIVLERLKLLTVATVLLSIFAEFLVASILMLSRHSFPSADTDREPARDTLKKMSVFMLPLLLPLVLQSCNGFLETWLLQIFGGPREQGFFNIAQQYANIGLVFGFSATNVFWKEMAAADARGDRDDMKRVYVNSSRVLFAMAAVIAGFGCFWSSPILALLLGDAYAPAGPAFSLTLLSSVFQCFGIVMTVTFLATSRTRLWSIFTILYALAGLPLTVILVAVLHLGAAGLALKLVLLNASFILLYDWYICRAYQWRMDNVFRALLGIAIFAVGAADHEIFGSLLPGMPPDVRLLAGGLAYGLAMGAGGFFLARRFGYWDRLLRLFSPAAGA